MIIFNSLNTIIDDIINEVRNNNIAESESLNRIQIEQWIIQYRSVLIKQDIDKGRNINPDYIQEINNIVISDKFDNGSYISTSDLWIGRSTIEIPGGVDFHFEDSIVSITDEWDNLIQLTSEKRAKRQVDRRYVSKESIAYERDGHIYIVGQGDVKKINIRAVFENPLETILGLTADDRYPIPSNMIPTLKEMIIKKEILITLPVDNINNSRSDIENIGQGAQK